MYTGHLALSISHCSPCLSLSLPVYAAMTETFPLSENQLLFLLSPSPSLSLSLSLCLFPTSMFNYSHFLLLLTHSLSLSLSVCLSLSLVFKYSHSHISHMEA